MGGQRPPQNTSTPKAIQTTKQDIGYYAHCGQNLSKPCVACTFKFLISATPYLKLTTLGIPLGGQAVKHRQMPSEDEMVQVRVLMAELLELKAKKLTGATLALSFSKCLTQPI
jgi:hypothetical protein